MFFLLAFCEEKTYSRRVDEPAFLNFEPVPVKGRRDGWTPEIQRRFIVHLARGAGAGEAARRVGRSRQTAYALCRRAGGEGFAAAWHSAIDFAAGMRAAHRPLGFGGVETLMVPRFYRGRLLGFVQRDDCAAAMRQLAALDSAAERLDPRAADEHAAAAKAKADKADSIRHAKGRPSSALKPWLRQRRPDPLG